MSARPGLTYQSASGIVSNIKSKIFKIIVTPDGTNASYVDVHDGVSAKDPIIMRLRVPATTSVPFNFANDNLIVDRGIFLAFEANLSSVTIFWAPESP